MNRSALYGYIRRRNSGVFGTSLSQAQVDGCEVLLDATENVTLRHRAYLLATAYHETARTMQPVRETLAKSDDSAIRILDRAWAAGKLGQVKSPYWRRDADGRSWLGRGYVQLTHRYNYAKAQQALNVALLSDPALAMVPAVASRILVRGCIEGWFTGKRLGDFQSYLDMRRVVNGTDKAEQIARYANAFEGALAAMIAAPGPQVPPVAHDDAPMSSPPAVHRAGGAKPAPPVPQPVAADDAGGFWARLFRALLGILRGTA